MFAAFGGLARAARSCFIINFDSKLRTRQEQLQHAAHCLRSQLQSVQQFNHGPIYPPVMPKRYKYYSDDYDRISSEDEDVYDDCAAHSSASRPDHMPDPLLHESSTEWIFEGYFQIQDDEHPGLGGACSPDTLRQLRELLCQRYFAKCPAKIILLCSMTQMAVLFVMTRYQECIS